MCFPHAQPPPALLVLFFFPLFRSFFLQNTTDSTAARHRRSGRVGVPKKKAQHRWGAGCRPNRVGVLLGFWHASSGGERLTSPKLREGSGSAAAARSAPG
ncbi:MAG: hypothetical protein BJ554DRAFT_4237 [Olpidium bornovanus]|uniref:Secreted protein n=1 Tax=Olpidium bornovanus TaxID=278681 RepID=A0A8H7ZMI3_9FUNG|nr:MAG: hypothetical protein BJ554DRAFT_4237 [Olpidium bornovanus]